MTTDTLPSIQRQLASQGQLIAGFSLSWIVAAVLLAALVLAGGIWNQLANTRVLSLMIEGGVVRYHDKQIGFIPGVPELKYFMASQDPVAWSLVLLAIALMLGYWFLKSIQFHQIAAAMGSRASVGTHSRAFLFGQGLNRWLPFHQGDVGTLLALRQEGCDDEETVLGSLYLGRFFILVEIAFFSLLGLFFLGWGDWFAVLFWPLVIFTVAYLMVRRPGGWHAGLDHASGLRQAVHWLLERPLLSFALTLLSVVAFFLEHVAVYALAQAFTSAFVILNIEFSVFLMALVGGSIARLIPVTPGGLGQYEIGFATVVFMSGTGAPEAVTVAILFGLLRYGVGALISLVLRLFYSVNVSLKDVLASVRVGL